MTDWVVMEPAVVPQIIDTPMPVAMPTSTVATEVPPITTTNGAEVVGSRPCVMNVPQPMKVEFAPPEIDTARHSTLSSSTQGRLVVAPGETTAPDAPRLDEPTASPTRGVSVTEPVFAGRVMIPPAVTL